MKKIKKLIINNYHVLFILLVSIIFVIPFIKYYVSGHDTNFHAATITSITKSFQNGNIIYPRILPLIANDFGYATPIFYAPIPHFITALLFCIINLIYPVSVWTSMKMIHFVSIFLSGLFMYLFVKRLSRNKNVSLLSAIIYMTFPYKLCEIFIRDAYAESLSFIFLPLIFWGIYELLDNNSKSFYRLFIIGMSGIILTHNITAIFTCVILIIYILFNAKKFFKKEIIIRFIVSGLFIFGITAVYTLPILEQKLFGNINIFFNGQSSASWVNTYALKPLQLLPIIGSQSFDGIQFHILLIPLILVVLSIIFLVKRYRTDKNNKDTKNYLVFLIIGILITFCTTTLFPWEKISGIFLYIQFPWRLLVFSIFFISIIGGYSVKIFNKKQTIITFILCIFTVITSGLSLNKERFVTNEDISNISVKEFGLGAINDYMPVKAVNNIGYFNTRNQDIIVIKGIAKISNVYKNTPYVEFEVSQSKDDISYIEVPLLYYKGYDVVSTIDNDSDIQMYENNKGFVELKIKGSQKVIINYVGTKIMNISLYISIITFVLFILFYCKGDNKNVKKN